MYRFLLRPRWLLFHAIVALGVAGMVMLGFWQRSRLEDRREFNAVVSARAAEPIAPVETVVGPPGSEADPASIDWRGVTAVGRYLPDEQVLIVTRSQAGRAGVNVVTPLELADGRLLIVNRGFVPGAGDLATAPPEGVVEIAGRLRQSQPRRFGGLSDPEGELTEMQRIDIARMAEQLPAAPVPVYLDLVDPDQQLPVPVPAPSIDEGPHLSYMFQWWFFAGCAAVGWVVAVRRSIRSRRISAANEPTEAGSPPQDEPASTMAAP